MNLTGSMLVRWSTPASLVYNDGSVYREDRLMQFDPANMEHRRLVAEQLLSTLVYALEGLARDQGYLQHRVNLPYSIAANHVRIIENHEAEQDAA